MKLHYVRILLSAAIVMLFSGTVSRASTRARFAGETVLKDPSVRISAGGRHTCQVNEDGTVRCWGANDFGQLGNGGLTSQPTSFPVPVSGLTNAVAITAGSIHTCALLADGTVRCWGDNLHGQLGDGGTINRLTPIAVSGLSNAVAITAAFAHTCALLSTGNVRCWGFNSLGQLGDGTSGVDRRTPVTVTDLTNAVAIAAAGISYLSHTCAVLADGTARCWGSNHFGEVGDGATTDRHRPVAVSGLSNVVAITGGDVHTCALLTDGTGRCWGFNNDGQVGDATRAVDRHLPVVVSGLSNAVAITAAREHTCALLADGTGRCWGENTLGELGAGAFEPFRLTPVAVSGLSNAVAVTAGDHHGCALLASGAATCWGANESGQLGTGTTAGSIIPTAVAGGGGSFTARDIAAGRNHTCAVRANGLVACWGSNDSGQIGDGTIGVNRLSPVAVPGLTNVVAIAAGDAHTCALLAAGTVRCWGANASGQLGNGTTSSSPTPVAVTGLSNAVAVAAGGTLGSSHSCALLANGTVRCWGANGSGQLGDGTSTGRLIPVTVRTNPQFLPTVNLSSVFAIAVGEFHSCALLADGSARCWGLNTSGQLGDGGLTNQLLAVPPAGVDRIAVAIAAGSSHTCILAAVGVPFCWGDNTLGQLGDATQQRRLTATLVSLGDTVAIAGGFGHTCALVVSGAARCWGDNSVGQLGDSTTLPHWFPAPVMGRRVGTLLGGGTFTITTPLTRAVTITTGRRHSCALISTGGVSCWGDNTFGQLGFGSTALLSTSPGAVPSFTLNIDPTVIFPHNSRLTTVTVVATCEAGQRLFIDVNLTQGTASGRGVGTGECTGGLERYPVTVPAQGRDPFLTGPAQVSAEAVIRDNGSIVDVQEWTRLVNIVNAP